MRKIFVFLMSLCLMAALASPASAWKLPDTGQTQSYTDTFGEDSEYTINPQSYTRLDANGKEVTNPDGSWSMVRDNVTGLIWEVKTDDGSIHDKDKKYTWYDSNPKTNWGFAGTPGDGTDTEDFISALNSVNFGGFSDWRLPTVKELAAIVNSGSLNPAVNTAYFPNNVSYLYWTANTDATHRGYAWLVRFDSGLVPYGFNKWDSYYVRAVRGEQNKAALVENSDGTVTDRSTGLMWQQAVAGPMNWEAAIVYCEKLSLAGHNDWRLPNRNELQSLVDYNRCDPSINTTAFPKTESSYCWTSTTCAGSSSRAWLVSFGYGYVHFGNKSNSHSVRPVRGGKN